MVTDISSLSLMITPVMGYLYLIYEKSQSLDIFKIYKVEVKNQQNRKIKAVRSDRGDKYYDNYDRSGRYPGLFTDSLEECGIVAQYTMPEHLVKKVLLRDEIAH